MTEIPKRLLRSWHQVFVDQFMEMAKQELPETPCIPSEEVRILRAKLILEEALETIEALGVSVFDDVGEIMVSMDGLRFHPWGEPNLVKIVDGCADIAVVTTGTLSACGISEAPMQRLVDENNLAKFGPGHQLREDGKLIKPPGHRPPDFGMALKAQGWDG